MTGILSYSVCLLLAISNTALSQSTVAKVLKPTENVQQAIVNTNITLCPQVMCTREFIPESCRDVPVIAHNGTVCYGCPQWKPSCQKQKDDIIKGDVVPPLCPENVCTLEFIPNECREIPKINVNGTLCDGCPTWNKGCQEKASSSITNGDPFAPRVSCPLLNCGIPVPEECRVEKRYTTRGQVCSLCPDWREGCREAERLVVIKTPKDAMPTSCPKFPCDVKIPIECQEAQPFNFRGRQCFRCPTWREGCSSSSASNTKQPTTKVKTPFVSCPLMRCDRRRGVHKSCYEKDYFMFRGMKCENCPTIKKECLQVVPPRPIVAVDGFQTSGRQPELACPLLACPAIYIPEECREIPSYSVGGKMCQGCPAHIYGCVPSVSNMQSDNTKTDTKLPTIPDIACPLKACTLMLIPPECREEQPYDFNGHICYECPRWRAGCVPDGKSNNTPANRPKPEVTCPLFGCPKIFIPPECREARPFRFQGKTCFRCPIWREGCIPQGSNSNTNGKPQILPLRPSVEAIPTKPEIACPLLRCQKLDVPSECLAKKTFEFQGKQCADCPTQKPNCPKVIPATKPKCPVVPCPLIAIPTECREEQPYKHNGQTCFKCPKRKSGCVENQLQSVQPSMFVTAPTPTSDAMSLLNLVLGPIPVREIISQVNMLTCPPLPCPDMLIPTQCREETSYLYQDTMCRGCPRWRLGCQLSSGTPMNLNANGILSFSLFNEMFIKK